MFVNIKPSDLTLTIFIYISKSIYLYFSNNKKKNKIAPAIILIG